MKQTHIDKIKQLVNQDGLINAINLLGGNKDIIRKVYTDNPESYLDYLIGNLMVSKSNSYDRITWTYNFKKNIFNIYDEDNIVFVDDFIWNYFYGGIMQFDNTKISTIFTEWFTKHIPPLSERKPMVYSDIEDIRRKWINSGVLEGIEGLSDEKKSRDNDYLIKLSRSVADSYNSIDVGK